PAAPQTYGAPSLDLAARTAASAFADAAPDPTEPPDPEDGGFGGGVPPVPLACSALTAASSLPFDSLSSVSMWCFFVWISPASRWTEPSRAFLASSARAAAWVAVPRSFTWPAFCAAK